MFKAKKRLKSNNNTLGNVIFANSAPSSATKSRIKNCLCKRALSRAKTIFTTAKINSVLLSRTRTRVLTENDLHLAVKIHLLR